MRLSSIMKLCSIAPEKSGRRSVSARSQIRHRVDRGAHRVHSTVKQQMVATPQVNDEGDRYYDLGNKKRLTLTKFKGKQLIDIREYYEKGDMSLPGRKGISLNMDNWQALVDVFPEVVDALSGKKVDDDENSGDKEHKDSELKKEDE